MKSKIHTPIAGQNIITRGLPKTGQRVQFQAGDDGNYAAGWWKGRFLPNNRQRWIAKTIGGDDIVLDRATGLMWAADGAAAGCNNSNTLNWAAAIVYAEALNFAGFDDWRLPNVKELFSIIDFSQNTPAIDADYLPNTSSTQYWTSTSYDWDPQLAWTIDFIDGETVAKLKIGTKKLRCVRKGL